MSIVFDQVEGVVQKEGDASTASAGAADTPTATPQRPASEQLEEAHRRLAWLTLRITAD